MDKKDDKSAEGAAGADEKKDFVDTSVDSQPGAADSQDNDDGGKKQDGKSTSEKLAEGGDEALEPPHKQSAIDDVADSSLGPPKPLPTKKIPRTPIQKVMSKLNIYLMMFIVAIALGGGTIGVMAMMSKKEEAIDNAVLPSTELSQEDLEKLRITDANVGDPKQTLTVESNAIFTGKVLIRSGLDVAGDLKVGGSFSIPTINVSGDGTFTRIAVNTLDAAGNVTIGGDLEVQGDFNSTGGANFGGAINAPRINITTFAIQKFTAAGNTPGRTAGPAVGSGGTVSINGADSTGTVTINTGGGTVAGILANIVFTQKFNIPHPVISPSSAGCAGISYYVTNVTQNGFSIATTTAAPIGQNCKFEYIVFDQ